jgi:hypothetical protein
MALNRKFLSRGEERSKLIFYFSNPEESDRYTVVRLPFYENPKISESKRARYQDHKLISRSSNLYTYLGADSRRLSLTFNISLPHLQEEFANRYVITRNTTIKAKGTSLDKSKFFPWNITNKNKESPTSDSAQKLAESLRSKQRDLKYPDVFGGVGESFNPGYIAEKSLLAPSEGQKQRRYYASLVSYWINIIRSSVVNNSSNPLYGPPIIRLRHGILYQDVPLICKDYSIQHVEEAGYDVETLLPRIITVSMNLEEFRAGDFGEFNPTSNDPLEKDNLAGWETVLEHETADPGLGYIEDADKTRRDFNVPELPLVSDLKQKGQTLDDTAGPLF